MNLPVLPFYFDSFRQLRILRYVFCHLDFASCGIGQQPHSNVFHSVVALVSVVSTSQALRVLQDSVALILTHTSTQTPWSPKQLSAHTSMTFFRPILHGPLWNELQSFHDTLFSRASSFIFELRPFHKISILLGELVGTDLPFNLFMDHSTLLGLFLCSRFFPCVIN